MKEKLIGILEKERKAIDGEQILIQQYCNFLSEKEKMSVQIEKATDSGRIKKKKDKWK